MPTESSFPGSIDLAFRGSICNARGSNYPFVANLTCINQIIVLPSGFIFCCGIVGASLGASTRIVFICLNPDLSFNNAIYSTNSPGGGPGIGNPAYAANIGNTIFVVAPNLAGLRADPVNKVQIYSLLCNATSGALTINSAFNNLPIISGGGYDYVFKSGSSFGAPQSISASDTSGLLMVAGNFDHYGASYACSNGIVAINADGSYNMTPNLSSNFGAPQQGVYSGQTGRFYVLSQQIAAFNDDGSVLSGFSSPVTSGGWGSYPRYGQAYDMGTGRIAAINNNIGLENWIIIDALTGANLSVQYDAFGSDNGIITDSGGNFIKINQQLLPVSVVRSFSWSGTGSNNASPVYDTGADSGGYSLDPVGALCLARYGTGLLVGGTFTTIGSSSRNRIANLDNAGNVL